MIFLKGCVSLNTLELTIEEIICTKLGFSMFSYSASIPKTYTKSSNFKQLMKNKLTLRNYSWPVSPQFMNLRIQLSSNTY